VPVDGFFEWRAIKGARIKQPYAIAMKDGSPFALAGLWENWPWQAAPSCAASQGAKVADGLYCGLAKKPKPKLAPLDRRCSSYRRS
jgi:putative SOS response-associated peptidase YedK